MRDISGVLSATGSLCVTCREVFLIESTAVVDMAKPVSESDLARAIFDDPNLAAFL